MNIKKQLVRGFTIAELMVVVVIIVILATITFVSYKGVTRRATVASLKSDLSNASDLLRVDQAHSSTSTFPATLADVDSGNGITSSSGNTFQYTVNNTNTPRTFCLTANNGSQNFNVTQDGRISAGVCPVLYFDAGVATSYKGTGTNVTDLSGKGRSGTLSGGTGYSSTDGGGSWTFDGVNDVITFGTGNTVFPLQNFSMELWFKSNGTTPVTGTSPALLGVTYGVRLSVSATQLSFGLDSGTAFTYANTPSTYSFYNSSWHQVVIQADSSNRKIYVDGVLAGSLDDIWSGITRWPTNQANIGRDNNNSMYFFNGSIASFKIYATKLSASEIEQNFETSRSRYGI